MTVSSAAKLGLKVETHCMRGSELESLSNFQDRVKLPVFGEVNEFMNNEFIFIGSRRLTNFR